MADYILSCCSTADLPAEQLERRNISFACYHYTLDGEEYPDDLGKTMDLNVFYEKLIAGSDAGTSQVSIGEFCDYFEKLLKQDMDILHVSLSSGISGTYTSALSAAGMLKDKYPDRRIEIVDSYCASSGYGLLMDALADRRDEGLSLDELRDWAEAHKREVHHWFFSSDLTWYVKGGRVSAPAGWIGGILGICPVLHVDDDGKLIPREKVRTKKKAMKALVSHMKELAENGTKYNGKCYICNSYCLDDAKEVAALVESTFPDLDGKVQICDIGTVIGSHTGPGTIALFFWGSAKR